MKKFKNYLMLISLLIIPNIVLASTNNTISLYEAVFYEAFTTIFATLFVLKPLSKLFSETRNKKIKTAHSAEILLTPFLGLSSLLHYLTQGQRHALVVKLLGLLVQSATH